MKFLPFLLILLLSACTPRQPIPVGHIPNQTDLNQSEIQSGSQVFNQLSSQYKINDDIALNNRVRNIVTRLSDAASPNGLGNPWHTYILEDPNLKNAGATKGNYIFVWTGLINSTEDDHQLATVLAHEVSHVLADHTTPTAGELTGKAVSGIGGQVAAQVAAGAMHPSLANIVGQITNTVLEGLIVNPGSQRLETEADTIGIFLMAKAGFHPGAALSFWKKAVDDPSFSNSNVRFLSSHPPSRDRLEHLRKLYPDALKVYRNQAK